MKANEIKINNLVFYGASKEIKVVKEVTSYSTVAMVRFEKEMHINPTLEILPIPITEEWLLKFGFEKTQNSYKFGDYQIVDIHNGNTWLLEEFDYENVCFVGIGKGMNYIHQLQNLYFALTGEELTLKSE